MNVESMTQEERQVALDEVRTCMHDIAEAAQGHSIPAQISALVNLTGVMLAGIAHTSEDEGVGWTGLAHCEKQLRVIFVESLAALRKS